MAASAQDKNGLADVYSPSDIELRWQRIWKEQGVFRLPLTGDAATTARPKYYVLEMFPYPSGRIHMGHIRNYTIGDVLARSHRMTGHRVLYSLGWDAFGLPAENAALKAQVHPRTWTEKNIETMKSVLFRLGQSYDDAREIKTCDPSYYVHEQRLFIEMYKRGLAYRKAARVHFCPTCNTVLANEQVEEGLCWRCQSVVEERDLVQWFFRITDYADQLLTDVQQLEGKWPDKVLNMQRQWIGRSTGAVVRFALEHEIAGAAEIEVFTTRPDTLPGVTFLSLAPEHPLATALARGTQAEAAVAAFLSAVKSLSTIDRASTAARKEGVFTGRYALHPITREKIPIYLANFVLMEYGSGAVMAVPAHDERDFEFAKMHGLPLRQVVQSPVDATLPYTGPGQLIQSGSFDGLGSDEAKTHIVAWLQEQGRGEPTVQYRLRDWLVSRQRYWGCPIPMVQCTEGGHGYQPVPADQLPVQLPEDVSFASQGGPSPLVTHPTWRNTTCPVCNGPALRETDTMDGFVESSWYFLRYADPHNPHAMVGSEALSLLPVDQYIGGAEHATKHLIYARFFTKMLRDFGMLPSDFGEPFVSLLTQGMVLKDAFRCPTHDYLYPEEIDAQGACTQCGQQAIRLPQTKMSKSFRNVVEPLPLIERYGADTVRLFCLFAAPPDTVLEWNDEAIEGPHRFIQRVYRLVQWCLALPSSAEETPSIQASWDELRKKTHKTIRRVRHDIFDRKQLNTAVAALMEFCNELYALFSSEQKAQLTCGLALREAIESLIKMLCPMAPHVAEELWAALGHTSLLVSEPFPVCIDAWADDSDCVIVVQVNGKKRADIRVPKTASEEAVVAQALLQPNVVEHTASRTIVKQIYVAGRILNIVVR